MDVNEQFGVQAEHRDGISVWTLNRPERSNALSRATVRELGRLAAEAATDPKVRVVVLTGAGERVFCAGADLKERRGMSDADVHEMLGLYRSSFDAIDRLPKPTIAAMNGVAFGGGLELALACDLRVAGPNIEVGLIETSLGIIPGAGGTQRLVRVIGEARAKEMILLARRIDAAEALRIGLVHRVALPSESALDCAMVMATTLAAGAPIALSAALDAIDAASSMARDQAFDYERACYERTLTSQDRLEGLAAFAEKRPPRFEGR